MKEIFHFEKVGEFEQLMEEVDDPLPVVLASVVIDYPGSLYERLSKLNIVARLYGIKQLGLAHACNKSARASDTRYVHSLDCAAKADYIAQTHGLEDKRDLLVTTEMLHDVGSLPFSDSPLGGVGITDEEQFERMLDKCPQLDPLLEEYSISKKEIIGLVTGKNQSPLGQMVNSKDSIDIDRWAFNNSDAWNLMVLPVDWKVKRSMDPFEHFIIDKGRLIFTDIKSVSKTLELRAHMFGTYYKNPQLLAKEAFMGQVTKNLLERGVITKDSIFEMDDHGFEYLIRKHYSDIGRKIFEYYGGFETYGMVDASENDVEGFLEQKTSSPFIVKKPKKANPAIGTPVMIGEQIDIYKNWRPEHARSLEKRMSAWSHTTVYGHEDDTELREAVAKAQNYFGKIEQINL